MPEAQLVVFRVGSYEYGIPVTDMHEIARIDTFRPLSGAAPGVVGLTTLRGRLLPVLDLRERLGLPRTRLAHGARVVVARVRDDIAAIVTDEISEVVSVPASGIESVPAASVGAASKEVRGVAHLGDRWIFVLEVERLGQARALPEA